MRAAMPCGRTVLINEASMPNDTPPGLTAEEIQDLTRAAGVMVPADSDYNVPSAGDPMIVADMVATVGRDLADVRAALAALNAMAGGALAAVTDDDQAEALVVAFLARESRASTILGRVVLQCYYRDDRVVRSLGQEPGAPFPKGRTLDQGDWSLLDVVRTRAPFWRDDRRA